MKHGAERRGLEQGRRLIDAIEDQVLTPIETRPGGAGGAVKLARESRQGGVIGPVRPSFLVVVLKCSGQWIALIFGRVTPGVSDLTVPAAAPKMQRGAKSKIVRLPLVAAIVDFLQRWIVSAGRIRLIRRQRSDTIHEIGAPQTAPTRLHRVQAW